MKLLLGLLSVVSLFSVSSSGFSGHSQIICHSGKNFDNKHIMIREYKEGFFLKHYAYTVDAQSSSDIEARELPANACKFSVSDIKQQEINGKKVQTHYMACKDLNNSKIKIDGKDVELNNASIEFKWVKQKSTRSKKDVSGYQLTIKNDGETIFHDKYFSPATVGDYTGRDCKFNAFFVSTLR